MEIWKWRPFRAALSKKNRKIFDEMLSIPRFYNVAGTMTCRAVLVHVILMSVIFEHYKQLTKLASKKRIENSNYNGEKLFYFPKK
jgi:hypothetical protein